MTPDMERFLDLATRPLEASPGDREEAKGELMSRLAHGGVPYELLDLGEPIGRLEAAKPPRPGLRRSLLLSGAFLLTAAVVAATAFLAWEIFLMAQAGMMSSRLRHAISVANSDIMPVMKHARSTAPQLPLGAHPRAGTMEETSEALEKNPDDLALLQEHIIRRLREEPNWDGLTAEERETIDRLDPDNALWSLIQINPALAKATGAPSSWPRYRSLGSKVTSEPDFEVALRLFSEAASKPAFFDRSDSLKRRQLDAFPPARSLSEFTFAEEFSELASPPFDFINYLGPLADHHTAQLVASGDKDGLVKFYREWKQLNKTVVGSPESGETDYSGVFHQLGTMGRSLGKAFGSLGMTVEKAEVEAQLQVMDRLIASNASVLTNITDVAGLRLGSEGRLPADLTAEEVLPSRRVELSFFDRIVATAFSCLALVFAGLVAFETCRRSRIVKGMARGLMPLFRVEDHLWIAGLGIVLPWLWWWVISRMTPLGWQEGTLDDTVPTLVWPLQFSAGLIFATVMLVQTARWRWSVRGGFLGLGASMPWIGWGVAALTALAIPIAGSLRYFVNSLGNDERLYFLLGIAGMSACGILWLLWQGVMTLFTPRSGALRPNLAMRSTLPWAMTGVATLLASVVISAMMERHWFAKDPLFPASTSKTHINALHERLARETREAARDL
jgi:hypothetical protein